MGENRITLKELIDCAYSWNKHKWPVEGGLITIETNNGGPIYIGEWPTKPLLNTIREYSNWFVVSTHINYLDRYIDIVISEPVGYWDR